MLSLFIPLTYFQTVRRLALSALNSAARTKPHLVHDHLPALLPILYSETAVKPDLIRTVQMGPWQHKVDEGLDARKTAWETLYTLVSIQLSHKRSLLTTDVHITVRHLPPQTRPPDVPDTSPPCAHRSVGRDQSSRTPAPRTPFDHHTRCSSSPCTTRYTHAVGDDDARGTDHEGHGKTGSRARGRVETKHVRAVGAGATGGIQKSEVFVEDIKRNE